MNKGEKSSCWRTKTSQIIKNQGGTGRKVREEKQSLTGLQLHTCTAGACFLRFITLLWRTCWFCPSRKKARSYWISSEDNKANILKQFYASMHLYNNLLNITMIPSLLTIFIILVKGRLFAAVRNHKGLATFNFLKNVYFLPDGKIKLHKHCQQVESSNVFISTTEASKPSIILLLMFGNSCSWHGDVLYMSALKD